MEVSPNEILSQSKDISAFNVVVLPTFLLRPIIEMDLWDKISDRSEANFTILIFTKVRIK
jgi:hypothetical protein